MAKRPSKRVPRYREIAHILRAELAEEVYSLGGIFPKELDLCERFAVSRFTVRNAMAELEAAGLVERRKAIGTIVRALEPAVSYVQTLQTIEGLLHYAQGTSLDISEMIKLRADFELAEWFAVEEGSRILRLAGLRTERETGRKMCWTEIYIRPEFEELLEFLAMTIVRYTGLSRRSSMRRYRKSNSSFPPARWAASARAILISMKECQRCV